MFMSWTSSMLLTERSACKHDSEQNKTTYSKTCSCGNMDQHQGQAVVLTTQCPLFPNPACAGSKTFDLSLNEPMTSACSSCASRGRLNALLVNWRQPRHWHVCHGESSARLQWLDGMKNGLHHFKFICGWRMCCPDANTVHEVCVTLVSSTPPTWIWQSFIPINSISSTAINPRGSKIPDLP